MMRTLSNARTIFAAAAFFALPMVAKADTDKTNPVTGETETYVNTFTGGADGTATEWNSTDNWDPSVTPFIATTYTPSLVSNKRVSTSTAIDGWNLQVGAYNGAAITWNSLGKIQGDTNMWLTVDATSSITIYGWGGGNLGQNGKNLNYYVAAQNGVTWGVNLASGTDQGLTMNYYLAGSGSVSYKSLDRASHVIKQADFTLSGTSQVSSKTLVSFASTTKTFTADAAIKVYGTDGTTLATTVNLATVNTTGTTTLTLDSSVGTCELVQTATGIVLYWVDGDPATIVAKTYTPSININFCFGDAPLTTAADVGYSGYAVPGTSWNNMTSTSPANGNGTFTTPLSTVYAVKADGTLSLVSGASVALSGTPGSYKCGSLAAATDLRHGYIDENANNTAPTVTVSGIPYDKYKVVVYTSTDTADSAFGYISVNGKNYTYVSDALTEDTTAWGASGAYNSANAIAEGVNMLVTPTISGATATIVGHKLNGRGCIAAVQIVKVEQQVGENDLLIELDGDRTYTFDEAKAYSGTVYVLGEGTLTFDGAASTAATLHIGPAAAVNMVDSVLTPAAVTGNGTVVYDGAQPSTTLGFDDSANWQGTVWVKNVGDTSKGEAATAKVTTCLGSNTEDATSNDLNKWGNASSFVKFTNVRGYMATANVPWTLILEDDSSNYAWYNNEGWTARTITIAGLKGNGTFWDVNNGGTRPFLNFTDASQFTGSINATGKQVFLSGSGTGNASNLSGGRITVPANQTLTVASGKTWNTRSGLVVNGTLNVNGTLASDSTTAAVSGSGTVVFTGKLPSPTGDTWWKNSAWDGTVQVKNAAFTGVSGVTTYLEVNKYGNDGSVLELNNCSGWLPVGNTSGDNVCAVPLKVTGTLNINNGYSGRQFTINKLLGDGAIYTDSNGATVTIQVLNADGFTGKVQLNSKRVVFGETIPGTFTSGQIYVGSDFTFTVPNENAAWYGTGGILLDGELKANALSNFGGGTTITTTDNGVFTLLTASQIDDQSTSYARITGTGTLRYADGGGNNWRTLSQTDFPTGMICENNIAAGLILKTAGGNHTIGSLAGSGQMRSDWGGSGNTGDRDLRILQAKDTIYSGVFSSSNDRVRDVYVAPGTSTAGTLTLSGTQTASNGLTVESGAAVNLTGTWVGETTVSGTIGGTGTLTGNLTFSAGSTFKAFASDDDGLSVSGSITYPESGTVTVDVSALGAPEAKVVLLTAANESDIDLSKFVSDRKYELAKEGKTLVLVLKVFSLEQRAGGEPVKVAATDALLTTLEGSGLSSTATTNEVNAFLNATDPNGLLRWENLATGTATNQPPLGTVSAETANGNALTLSVNMVSDTNETAKVDFGYTVLRELRKGDGETWTRVAGPSPDDTAFDIGLLNDSGASMSAAGLYRVVTLLAYGSVTNEIPSTNAIGIVEVVSQTTNTITAVPWKRLASAPGEASDLTVSNFVAYANLSAGDAVYMLDGRAYKMWKKKNDGTWEAATTVSGDGASISIKEAGAPDVATIPCGGAVWVQRADATKPYFLVGQYDESAFRVTVPGTNTVLIANPFPTDVTLNAITWGTSVTNDIIRIPRNGLHVDLSYKNGKWGYYKDAVITDGVFTGATFAPYEEPIPAGTGFIYDRKGREDFTFTWK